MDEPEIIGFHTGAAPPVAIAPAPRWRTWMNETNARSANRCLPMLVANEHGWVIENPETVTVTWDGRMHPDGVTWEYAGPEPLAGRVGTVFGSGVLTFTIPVLFRTPPGWNLLARGPANWPKDGVTALEGLVETDWAVATFTMNWKLTRPGLAVTFERGEPICMIVPQRRGDVESFTARFASFDTEPELKEQARRWSKLRQETHKRKFLSEYAKDFEDAADAWEQDYFRGRYPGTGQAAPEHQTKLRVSPFSTGP